MQFQWVVHLSFKTTKVQSLSCYYIYTTLLKILFFGPSSNIFTSKIISKWLELTIWIQKNIFKDCVIDFLELKWKIICVKNHFSSLENIMDSFPCNQIQDGCVLAQFSTSQLFVSKCNDKRD